MAHNDKRPKTYMLEDGPCAGMLVSLDDRCMKCGAILGEHAGIGSHCPPMGPKDTEYWQDVWQGRYWAVRGTIFLPMLPQLMLPNGA